MDPGHPQLYLSDRRYTLVGIMAPVELAAELGVSALFGAPVAAAQSGYEGNPTRVFVRAQTERTDGGTLNIGNDSVAGVSGFGGLDRGRGIAGSGRARRGPMSGKGFGQKRDAAREVHYRSSSVA
jgi:hypothetical protein